MPNMTGRRPRAATASATALGKLPPPQMIASGAPPPTSAMMRFAGSVHRFASSGSGPAAPSAFALRARPHQRTLAAGANEGNDFGDQRIVGKFVRQRLDTVGQPSFEEKQAAICAAQAMHLGA